MNEQKLAEAWEVFDKAADLEHRIVNDPGKADNAKRMARRNADKKLEQAVALEAEAFAA
jgi:hypothetical protein